MGFAGRHGDSRSFKARCDRSFKATRNIEDKIKWTRARAKATRTFGEQNKREWQSYVGTLPINTKPHQFGKRFEAFVAGHRQE